VQSPIVTGFSVGKVKKKSAQVGKNRSVSQNKTKQEEVKAMLDTNKYELKTLTEWIDDVIKPSEKLNTKNTVNNLTALFALSCNIMVPESLFEAYMAKAGYEAFAPYGNQKFYYIKPLYKSHFERNYNVGACCVQIREFAED
jgi:hypothetical protein